MNQEILMRRAFFQLGTGAAFSTGSLRTVRDPVGAQGVEAQGAGRRQGSEQW
ncbi:hypothetical protein ACH9EU_00845 [Kocuria sp. M1R5S2]|uniref:hypothetical protein n=1 Tax=Kocuria rhizosphaerae TaxID=3376285 RepID=UPI0037A18C81